MRQDIEEKEALLMMQQENFLGLFFYLFSFFKNGLVI